MHYEDDGVSGNYESEFATTKITNRKQGNNIRITIAPRKGKYDGMAASRAYELRFPAQLPPKRVSFNGKLLPYSRFGGVNTWSYDGYTLAPIVHVAECDCSREHTIELVYDANMQEAQPRLYGKQRVFNRCVALMPELKIIYATHYDPYPLMPDAFMNVSQAPNFILEDPTKIIDYIDRYEKSLDECIPTLEGLGVFPAEFIQRLKTQLLTK